MIFKIQKSIPVKTENNLIDKYSHFNLLLETYAETKDDHFVPAQPWFGPFVRRLNDDSWEAIPLSVDQRPDLATEKERLAICIERCASYSQQGTASKGLLTFSDKSDKTTA